MNKFKKLGLTALGTTLVASSAFAGEITASGDAGYTWSSESIGGSAATPATGSATNDGVGYNHDITLSGSGELDNGWSVSTTMILVEDSSLSSSNVKLTMGGLGSIVVGNGTGGTGANFDDATPRAYEENHDGMKTSTAIDNMGALLGNGGVDYYSPSFDLGGVAASFMYNYTPEVSGTAVGEGGVTTSSVDRSSGQAFGVNLSMGGISAGAYAATAKADQQVAQARKAMLQKDALVDKASIDSAARLKALQDAEEEIRELHTTLIRHDRDLSERDKKVDDAEKAVARARAFTRQAIRDVKKETAAEVAAIRDRATREVQKIKSEILPIYGSHY